MKTAPTQFDTSIALHVAMLAGWPFTWVSTRQEVGQSIGGDLVELNGVDWATRHLLGPGTLRLDGKDHPVDIYISFGDPEFPSEREIIAGEMEMKDAYALQSTHYAFGADEIAKMLEPELDPPSPRRYGPHDADPHHGGRRWRARKKRRS